MKKMDSLGLRLCSYQALLFEASAEKAKCSSPIFIRRFMNSDLATRLDKDGMVFDSIDIADAIKEVEVQYGESTYGKEKFSSEELHWIGYIYRYWAYISGRSSRQIYKMVKPGQLRKLYFPYHSLDPYQAIERIAEESGASTGGGGHTISDGVMALRKVRNKRKH